MSDLTYLVNPSEKAILKNAGDRLPLGLLYIAKELTRFNHPVKVYDLNHTPETKLFRDIDEERPTMIGVSCYTSPMVTETKKLLRLIRDFSKTRLIVGGYHPTFVPGDFDNKLVNNVVIGEGEYATECLVNNINGFITQGRNATLKGLGKPQRDLVPHTDYNMQMNGKRTATMITSRGCPNNCVFCGNLNRTIRYNGLDEVIGELCDISEQGYQAIYFLDDVFTISRERARFIGEQAKHLKLPFRVTTRANYLDEQKIEDLAKNGCDIVSMGIESGNNGILRNCGKNQTTEIIRDTIHTLCDYGIKSKGFFILGLPGETEETARQTINFANELKNYGMTPEFYPLMPFPGTAIWTKPEDYGIRIIDRDYSHYLQASRDEPKVVCETKGLKADRIQELLREVK